MVLVIRKYTFPFGVRVKAYWCMQQVLLLHVWKALSTPTFGFDGSKDPKSDTQSLLSTFWPSLGLLVFLLPKGQQEWLLPEAFSQVKAQLFVPQKSWTLSKISGVQNMKRARESRCAHVRLMYISATKVAQKMREIRHICHF